MDYRQYRRARRLVRECCNYDNGQCMALDEGFNILYHTLYPPVNLSLPSLYNINLAYGISETKTFRYE